MGGPKSLTLKLRMLFTAILKTIAFPVGRTMKLFEYVGNEIPHKFYFNIENKKKFEKLRDQLTRYSSILACGCRKVCTARNAAGKHVRMCIFIIFYVDENDFAFSSLHIVVL